MDRGKPNILLEALRELLRKESGGPVQSGAVNTFGILGSGRGLALQRLNVSANQPGRCLDLAPVVNVSEDINSQDLTSPEYKNLSIKGIYEGQVRDAASLTQQQTKMKLLKTDKKGTSPTSYKFRIGKLLGKGSYGKVSLATDTQGTQFAMKIVEKWEKCLMGDETQQEAALWEAKILKYLKKLRCGEYYCCEIVKSYSLEKERYLQFPLYGPTLKSRIYISENEGGVEARGFPVSQVREILRQLITALHFLHSHHIVHLDIKANNIVFLDGNWTTVTDLASNSCHVKMNNPEIRLIDFGVSLIHPEKEEIIREVCCSIYRPPEAILKTKISYPVDIWCAGLIAVAMYSGDELFRRVYSRLEIVTQMNAALGPFPPHLLLLNEAQRYFIDGTIRIPYRLGCRCLNDTYTPPPLRDLKRICGCPETDKLFDLIGNMLNLDSYRRITSDEALFKINNF